MSLSVNMHVPTFSVENQNGDTVSNDLLLGQKYILFFYGQDDTPTCTKQVCSASEVYDAIHAKGYLLFGVSADKMKKHQKFKEKYNFQFDLLSDPEKEMMLAFEAYGPKIFMGKEVKGVYRKSYVIDEKGIIKHIDHEVVAAQQGEMILAGIEKL